jgi:hypothetical protein
VAGAADRGRERVVIGRVGRLGELDVDRDLSRAGAA